MNEKTWPDVYGQPYNPQHAIQLLSTGAVDAAFSELWDRLYHQGRVSVASYAAVPALVAVATNCTQPNWNLYALLASIEESRRSEGAFDLPGSIAEDYLAAWKCLLHTALSHFETAEDDLLVRSIIAALALAKGQLSIASIALWTEDERQEVLAED